MIKWLALSCLVLLCSMGNAYKTYEDHIPNGVQVPDPCRPNTYWKGVGHKKISGGGPRNPFGQDFAANNHFWNETICRMDSDGDGVSNGEELGDPDCMWSAGSGVGPYRTSGLSHPGICEPLDSTICQSRNDFEVCPEVKKFECDGINDPEVLIKTIQGVPTKVPPADTTYICQLVDIPTDGDYHLIAHEPIIDNANVMHHMILYGCDDGDSEVEKYKEPHHCFQVPDSCNEAFAGWTLGDIGQCFDGPYGFRLGKMGKKKALLQYHWTNVEKRTDYMDGSGFKIYYTPKLRQYDAGSFTIGQTELNIPPQQSRVEITADCKSSCTQKLIKEQIYLTNANLHMHYLGDSGGMEMFRNGQKEKTLLWQDSYDYDTPYYEYYDPPVVFKAGDEMKLTCVYKSTTRKNSTNFGPGTFDEMCFGFFIYYPKLSNGYCGQHGEYDLCIDQNNVCNAAAFAYSEEFEKAYEIILKSCDPVMCIPGCREILITLKIQHPCLRAGPNMPNLLQQLYWKDEEEKVTDIFQRLISCGLKPALSYADKPEHPSTPPDPNMPNKPKQEHLRPDHEGGMEPTSWHWKDQVEYLRSIREIVCAGAGANCAWAFWVMALIAAIISLF